MESKLRKIPITAQPVSYALLLAKCEKTEMSSLYGCDAILLVMDSLPNDGHCLQEDLEAAISDCSSALVMEESYLKALSRRAWCYERKEEYWDKAVEDYRKVLEQDPANKTARRALLVRFIYHLRIDYVAP